MDYREVYVKLYDTFTEEERDCLENAMMVRTIIEDDDNNVSIQNACALVDHYNEAVAAYGSPLMKQEAAGAICDLLGEMCSEVLLCFCPGQFLSYVIGRADISFENAMSDFDLKSLEESRDPVAAC